MVEFITTKEAAAKLKVSERKIKYLLKRGVLAGIKCGRYWKINERAIIDIKSADHKRQLSKVTKAQLAYLNNYISKKLAFYEEFLFDEQQLEDKFICWLSSKINSDLGKDSELGKAILAEIKSIDLIP